MTKVGSLKNKALDSLHSLTIQKVMLDCGLYFAIAIVLIIFTCINDRFLTMNNIFNVFDQSAYYLVCAFGVTFVIISGSNDMSVGSQVAFYSVIGAKLLISTQNYLLTTVVLLGLALLVGAANGLFVVIIGLPPFVGTIAVGYIVRGIVAYITEQNTVSGLPKALTTFAWTKTFGIPNLSLISLVVMIICIYIIRFTSFGRKIYAVGGNRHAARVMGINVARIKISAYIISATFSVLAAIMLVARSTVARAGSTEILHLDCIAAAVIGGTSLKGGRGSIFGTFVGVMLICIIRNALNGMGVDTFSQLIFTGIITLFAACLDSYKSRTLE